MPRYCYGLSAGLMIATLLASAGCATAADSDSSASTVYLDPHTGQVVQSPSHGTASDHDDSETASDGAAGNSDTAGGKRVVRCADGSLRMGSTHGDDDAAGDHDDSTALCAKSGD